MTIKKLYELPKNTKFKLVDDIDEAVYIFDHMDGMYGYCFYGSHTPINLLAWADVEIVNDEGGQPSMS